METTIWTDFEGSLGVSPLTSSLVEAKTELRPVQNVQYHPIPGGHRATEEGGITSILKDEDGIPQYTRARLTVFTLLLIRLEPTSRFSILNLQKRTENYLLLPF